MKENNLPLVTKGIWQRMNETNKLYMKDSLTLEDLEKFMNDLFNEPRPHHKIIMSPYILLALSDEEFIDIWKNGSEEYTFLGGSESIRLVNERAKKLNLTED